MEDKNFEREYFGSWKIVEKIGEGSFGTVYKLERNEYGIIYTAALKIITIPQSSSEIKSLMSEGYDSHSIVEYFESFVSDFVNEIALMVKLKGNSNIVSYEDHAVIKEENESKWEILIRMEYLTPVLEYYQNHDIVRKDIIKLGIDICSALELCQRYNIVHRDIKPENIFVSANGDYKLGDFGIARTVEKTMGILSKKGTYTYMAPEVYKGEEYGTNIDLYSLGLVLYRFLNNNKMPFLSIDKKVASYQEREIALSKRMRGMALPKPINATDRLAEIILKACAYDPNIRYTSPTQMKADLEAVYYEKIDSSTMFLGSDQIDVHKSAFTDNKHADGRSYEKDGDVTKGLFDGKKYDKTVGLFDDIEAIKAKEEKCKKEEEERLRLEEERHKKEEEECLRLEEERRKKEEQECLRLEEERRKKEEQERLRLEEERRKKEEERRRKEEKERHKNEEAERKLKEEKKAKKESETEAKRILKQQESEGETGATTNNPESGRNKNMIIVAIIIIALSIIIAIVIANGKRNEKVDVTLSGTTEVVTTKGKEESTTKKPKTTKKSSNDKTTKAHTKPSEKTTSSTKKNTYTATNPPIQAPSKAEYSNPPVVTAPPTQAPTAAPSSSSNDSQGVSSWTEKKDTPSNSLGANMWSEKSQNHDDESE